MFTGLIQDIGEVVSVTHSARDMTVQIRAPRMDLAALDVGASVACNGVCLTLTQKSDGIFTAEISYETLAKTTAGSWTEGTRLNLEPSLKVGDELGGHLVYGHVDGVGQCVARNEEGNGTRFFIKVPETLAPYIAGKGSVAINGVSLTVNGVNGQAFDVMVIPHTAHATTLGAMQGGDKVNIEIDILARYLARLNSYKSVGT